MTKQNKYSLTQLREDVDNEYPPLELEVDDRTVVLRNIMRLETTDQQEEALGAFDDLQKAAPADGGADDMTHEQLTALSRASLRVLRAITDSETGEYLTDKVGNDIALVMKIVNLWVEVTNPGEAQNSPDS